MSENRDRRDHLGPIPPIGLVGERGEGDVLPMFGIVGFVGLCSSVGALGNRTGSVMARSLWRRPCVHPETKSSVPATAAKQAVVFISQLLRECMIGNHSVPRLSIAGDSILGSATSTR
jgi:hypothetical protein